MILIQKQKYSKGDRNLGLLQTSGASLAKELGLTIYTPTIKPRKPPHHPIINWGCSSSIPWLNPEVSLCNRPSSVANSSNKLSSFRYMIERGVRTVPFTTVRAEAEQWFDEGDYSAKVVCRTIINGSSGRGIVIAKAKNELVDCGLYTLYIKKKWEYRVHVVLGEVVHIQQKRRLSTEQLEERGIVDRCKYIRNLKNGYIFSGELDHEGDVAMMTHLCNQAYRSIAALDLDFGAVDILVTKDREVMVLEVNSAPGLEGTTLSKYVDRFKEVI